MSSSTSTSSISSSASSSSSLSSSLSSSASSISSSSSTTSSATSKPTGPTVVQTAGAFSHQGCYSEGTNGRALSATSTANNAMTIQKCATFCSGYKYMGVEYSSECYCANTIGAGAAPATSGCNMVCSGDATALCGGPNRLNFYLNNGGSQTSTSSSPASQTSTSTSPSNSGPAIVQKAGTFGYKGCYTEGASGRALSEKQSAQSSMTVEQCSTFCSGYMYMGVEYG